jgi:formiminotetrahydrofolate cyclodeaminase
MSERVVGGAAAGPVAAQTGSAAAQVLRAAAQAAGVGALAAQAVSLGTRLDRLAEDDARALERARSLMPDAEPDEPDARRDFALGRAIAEAGAVPLAIAEACADLVILAESLAPDADAASAPDVEAARLLAAGAARAAAHLVEVNLAHAPGDERLDRAQAVLRVTR